MFLLVKLMVMNTKNEGIIYLHTYPVNKYLKP